MTHPKVVEQYDDIVDPLVKSKDSAERFIDEVEADIPKPPDKVSAKKLADTINHVDVFTALVEDQFNGLGMEGTKQLESHRLFKFLHGQITRDGLVPNVLNVIAIIFVIGCIDAVLVAWTYSTDGKTSLLGGLGYGGLFAFLNLSIALAIGFTSRWAVVQYHDRFDVKKVNRLAMTLTTTLFALLVVMILSAMRMRTMPIDRELARHEDIWNLSEVTMSQAFSDGYSLILVGVAFMASLVGIFEGWGRLSDPIPGYTEEQKKTNALLQKGIDMAAVMKNTVCETADDAIEDFVAEQPTPEEIDEYLQQRSEAIAAARQHNSDVHAGEKRALALNSTVQHINASHSIPCNLSYLLIDIDAVRERLVLPDFKQTNSEDLIGTLNGKIQLAISAIEQAQMRYANAVIHADTNSTDPIKEI